MDGLLLSLVVGGLAPDALGALDRAISVTWARYEVRFGRLRRGEAQGTGTWLLGLEFRPPKWRRAVMQPLKEYLMIQRSKRWAQFSRSRPAASARRSYATVEASPPPPARTPTTG